MARSVQARQAVSHPIRRLTDASGTLRLESDDVHVQHFESPYPLVRWTDRWGARWEHRRGEVQQIRDDQDWVP